MRTHNIPDHQWQPFLDRFSTLHAGQRMDLELVGGGTEPRAPLCDEPLRRILAVLETEKDRHIDVEAGDAVNPRTVVIARPTQLSVTETDDGYPVALQIASHTGAVASLRFEPDPRHSDTPSESFLG